MILSLQLPQTSYNAKRLSIFLLSISIVLSLSSVLFLTQYIGIFEKKSEASAMTEDTGVEKFSVFAEILKPLHGEPKKLIAESINLKIDVIPVGVAKDGYMETPASWNIAGWYEKSAYAGDLGNVVINAHYDDNYGRPAAFWELKNLKSDDTLTLIDSLGKYYNYKVTEVFYVGIDDPNRLDVIEDNKDKSILTLITCGGVWNSSERTYSKRLVVRAELIR